MLTLQAISRTRWLWVLGLALCVGLPGCASSRGGAQPKVKVVRVIKDGASLRVRPNRVVVRKNLDAVVWVTDGDAMSIEFKPGNPEPGNPFTDLTCKARFCGALVPPGEKVPYGVYRYKVTVDGTVLDPEVEIQG
jgi:hypothetical protein